MVTVIVEQRFEDEFFDLDRHDEAQRRGSSCLALHGVRHVASYVTRDGRRMICVFEAPDAEAVRRAVRRLGLKSAGVWPATVIRGPGGTPQAT